MKRKYVIISVLSVFVLSLWSCKNESVSIPSNPVDSVKNEGFSGAIKGQSTKQDSLNRDLVEKIDSLTEQLKETKKQVVELEGKVEKRDNSVLAGISLVALFLSLTALLLAALNSYKKLSKKKMYGVMIEYLNVSCKQPGTPLYRLKWLENQIRAGHGVPNSSSKIEGAQNYANSDLADLKHRLFDLEQNVRALNETPKHSRDLSNIHKEDKVISCGNVKIGYANINSDNFFVEILKSKQETCVFSINFLGEEQGEFDIISLDKLKSRNGWQTIVEATGDCTLAEANAYDLIEKGQCKKTEDDNIWEVIKKLRIKIRR